MEYRIEHDTMGQVQVPADRHWGAQTQRSKDNFKIGGQRQPKEIITAFAFLKEACAQANAGVGKLTSEQAKAIADACGEIRTGKWDEEFPLVVWQTGSGTQYGSPGNTHTHTTWRRRRALPSTPTTM